MGRVVVGVSMPRLMLWVLALASMLFVGCDGSAAPDSGTREDASLPAVDGGFDAGTSEMDSGVADDGGRPDVWTPDGGALYFDGFVPLPGMDDAG